MSNPPVAPPQPKTYVAEIVPTSITAKGTTGGWNKYVQQVHAWVDGAKVWDSPLLNGGVPEQPASASIQNGSPFEVKLDTPSSPLRLFTLEMYIGYGPEHACEPFQLDLASIPVGQTAAAGVEWRIANGAWGSIDFLIKRIR